MRRKSDLWILFFLFMCTRLFAFFHNFFCVLNLIWKLISIQTIYQYLIADLKFVENGKIGNGFDSCWISFYWRHVLNKRITFVYGSINCLIFEYIVKSKLKQLEFSKYSINFVYSLTINFQLDLMIYINIWI